MLGPSWSYSKKREQERRNDRNSGRIASLCTRRWQQNAEGVTEEVVMIQLTLHVRVQVALGGDQLTAERARNVQLIRINSEDSKSALAGLLPYTSD